MASDPPHRAGVYPDLSSDDAIEAYWGNRDTELAATSVGTEAFNPGHGSDPASDDPDVPGLRKVGWSVVSSTGELLRAFAFNINPQAISRSYTSRTQMFATRGGFFVDDFGQGPTTITVTQLVGSGRTMSQDMTKRHTARFDVVIGFYENIYKYVVQLGYSDSMKYVRFHDSHWRPGIAEKVYFPANSFQVQRAVNLQNVWSVQIQMISLDPVLMHSSQPGASSKIYLVKHGDTLQGIVRRAIGAPPPTSGGISGDYAVYLGRLIELNKPFDDISKKRKVAVYSNLTSDTPSKTITAKRLQVYPGERILLPA
jgi:hypothetical protein